MKTYPVHKRCFGEVRDIREFVQPWSLPVQDLAAQLASIKYKPTSRGLIQIESKDDMKARGMASPDEADALALTYAKDEPLPVMETGRLNLLSR
jgi:hypothetical protein